MDQVPRRREEGSNGPLEKRRRGGGLVAYCKVKWREFGQIRGRRCPRGKEFHALLRTPLSRALPHGMALFSPRDRATPASVRHDDDEPLIPISQEEEEADCRGSMLRLSFLLLLLLLQYPWFASVRSRCSRARARSCITSSRARARCLCFRIPGSRVRAPSQLILLGLFNLYFYPFWGFSFYCYTLKVCLPWQKKYKSKKK